MDINIIRRKHNYTEMGQKYNLETTYLYCIWT